MGLKEGEELINNMRLEFERAASKAVFEDTRA